MASQMIAEEDLDFHMAYENEDEMGMLCTQPVPEAGASVTTAEGKSRQEIQDDARAR